MGTPGRCQGDGAALGRGSEQGTAVSPAPSLALPVQWSPGTDHREVVEPLGWEVCARKAGRVWTELVPSGAGLGGARLPLQDSPWGKALSVVRGLHEPPAPAPSGAVSLPDSLREPLPRNRSCTVSSGLLSCSGVTEVSDTS